MNEFSPLNTDNQQHSRVIIHIDLDCYYAQVEMLKDPSLRNKPFGVKQKNILVTCNYIARELGLQKCMLLHEAMKICPDLILVNGEDLYDYRKMSNQVTAYLQKYSVMTERLGLDENFIDVTDIVTDRLHSTKVPKLAGNAFDNPDDVCECGCEERLKMGSVVAQEIRDGLLKELGLTSSAGIAHNKLLAKLGGALHKPNQQTTVSSKCASELVLKHDISKIPGIGVATIEILKGINLNSVADVQNCDYKTLLPAFKLDKAKHLVDLCYGIDVMSVKPSGKPQSIGLEDSCKSVSIETEISEKFTQLLKRLVLLVGEDGRIPTTIKVTIRKLDNVNVSGHRETRQCNISPNLFSIDLTTNIITLKENSQQKLLSVVMNLFRKLVCNSNTFRITLLGLSFTKFLERNIGKKSIASYFMKDLAVQSITNIENKLGFSSNAPTTSKYSSSSPDGSEPDTEPLTKKFKCSSLLEANGSVVECDYSSPSKLKVADLRLNSHDTDDCSICCPPNADEEVFRELPNDVQREVWENWKREHDIDDHSIPRKKPKANTILNYFIKNC